VDPGQIIRERRVAHGLTQNQLAIRSGSTQAAISRLERGEISPTFDTFERLLAVMGEEADLSVRRPEADYDRARIQALRARPPADRLAQAISWNLLAGQFEREGKRARGRADQRGAAASSARRS
jgi:transcriptional regulator with XRE-family HTH domain